MNTLEEQQIRLGNSYVLPAFLLSCLIHSGLLFALIKHSNEPTLKNVPVFMVEMIPQKALLPLKISPQIVSSKPSAPLEIQKNERQYVSRPDAGLNEKPDKATSFLSDVNSKADKEQIHRGDGTEAGSIISKGPYGNKISDSNKETKTIIQKPNQKNTVNPTNTDKTEKQNGSTQTNTQPQSKTLPSSQDGLALNKKNINTGKSLDLSPDYSLLKNFAKNPQHQNNNTLQALEPAPFSRSAGSGARFIGLNGSSDYIQGVSDGDITLLNAKADKFAVFVRRVATQVFYQLKQQGWEYISASDIRQIQQDAVFRAKLSPQGNLLDVEFLQKSNSQNFDNIVLSAIQKSASGPHPPQDARAKDGNIYFIFMTKAWVQMGLARRGGIPRENRWLLLKTGLE